MTYRIFIRNWWRANKSYPNGLEPHAGPKRTYKKGILTESEARDICRVYNANHNPGKYSRKAEYELV